MKLKKNHRLFIISAIVVVINVITLVRNNDIASCTVHSEIAKAVINIEKDEVIKTEINEKSFPMEYYFSINNYNETVTNEVDFDYVIEIENFADNFPVDYTLIDCAQNKEIKLIDGKSEPMKISKNMQESKKFKLCLVWKELDSNLADETQIRLKVNAIQSKEEKMNEI